MKAGLDGQVLSNKKFVNRHPEQAFHSKLVSNGIWYEFEGYGRTAQCGHCLRPKAGKGAVTDDGARLCDSQLEEKKLFSARY